MDFLIKNVIYKLTSPSGKVYIGKSKNFNRRLKKYERLDCKTQPKIFKAILKYGFENFWIEIVDCSDSDKELNNLERLNIIKYDSFKNGYNCTEGGDGNSNPTPETRLKYSLARLGKPLSQEAKNKLSEKRKGMKFSEITKKKISMVQKGRLSPRCKPIFCFENGVTYPSSCHAAKALNLSSGNIREHLGGASNRTRVGDKYGNKYTFKYV